MGGMDMSEILFKAACPNNKILYDSFEKPSVMVYIPKFKMNQVITNGSDRVHPAFIVNGVERDGFYISKYQNTDIDGVGYSLPMQVPCNEVDITLSYNKSAEKGRGWHWFLFCFQSMHACL